MFALEQFDNNDGDDDDECTTMRKRGGNDDIQTSICIYELTNK